MRLSLRAGREGGDESACVCVRACMGDVSRGHSGAQVCVCVRVCVCVKRVVE